MSSPTKQMEELTIGKNMPTTRSQTHREQIGDKDNDEENQEERETSEGSPARDDDTSDERSGSDNDDPTAGNTGLGVNMLRAPSKLVYDLEGLGAETKRRAISGLTGHFDVALCRKGYQVYEFQLTDKPRVQIGSHKPKCSCSEYRSSPGTACQHIYWLVDQLYHAVLGRPPSPGIPLTSEGPSTRLPQLDDLLGNHLEAIAKNQNWPLDQGDKLPPLSPVKVGMTDRQDIIRDIMSAFNPSILPEDFRTDLTESTSRTRTPEQCVVQGDLEATIFRLAIHDDIVFSSLRKAMPAGACANIYFDKILKRCRDILSQFDTYRRTGRKPSSVKRLDVRDVAESLRQEVQRIHKNLSDREPYGTEGAAEALLTLLQDVSTRNIDAFEDIRWRRVAPAGEDEDDRNLYEQLIGSTNTTNNKLFVLEALERLPHGILGQYQGRLNGILTKIEINRAPSIYIRKLKSLLREAEIATNPKRPGPELTGTTSKRAR